MKKYYTLWSGDKYARYYTKDSLDADNKAGYQLFEEIYYRGQGYLSSEISPIGVKWNLKNNVDEILMDLQMQGKLFTHDENEPWNPPILKEDKLGKKRSKRKGDLHSVYSNFNTLLFSQKAVDRIGDILKKYGVLLPFEVEDREDKLYRFWVTIEKPLKCMDIEKSIFHTSPTPWDEEKSQKIHSIDKLLLNNECEDDDIIFRIKDIMTNPIFVTEVFIELIKKHKLKGFSFYESTSAYTSSFIAPIEF